MTVLAVAAKARVHSRAGVTRWPCALCYWCALCVDCALAQVAPAMNTFMWDSPFTAQHLDRLALLGVTSVPPVAKQLACGDVGTGAMAAPEAIAAEVQAALHRCGFVRAQPAAGSSAAADGPTPAPAAAGHGS
jgi:phosphopantothenoylcysteine synthetase/decarboxylase